MGVDYFTQKKNYVFIDVIFYFVFFCEFNYRFLTSTMFYSEYVAQYSETITQIYDIPYKILLGFTIFTILFLYKEPKSKILPISLLIVALLFNHFRSITTIKSDAIFIMLLICSKDKSYKTIGVISLISGWLWIIVSAVACKLGYIPDIVFGNRHSFGSIYMTDLACHFLTLFMVLCVIKKGKLNLVDYAFGLTLLFINITQMKAKIGLVCLFIVIAGTFFYQYILPHTQKNRGILLVSNSVCILFVVFIIPAVIYWTLTYTEDPDVIYNKYHVLSTLQSRFMLGRKAFDNYPISLWGTYIQERGNGGNLTGIMVEDYFFLDISYIRLLFHKGIVFLSAFTIIFVKIQTRLIKNKEYYIAFIVLVFLIDCTIEHHMIEIHYSLLIYLLFCSLPQTAKQFKPNNYIADSI